MYWYLFITKLNKSINIYNIFYVKFVSKPIDRDTDRVS